MFTPLQLEHFGIAKRLRQDRVTRIKITKSHSVAVALRAARLTETRLHAEIKRSARLCPDPSQNRGRGNRICLV